MTESEAKNVEAENLRSDLSKILSQNFETVSDLKKSIGDLLAGDGGYPEVHIKEEPITFADDFLMTVYNE